MMLPLLSSVTVFLLLTMPFGCSHPKRSERPVAGGTAESKTELQAERAVEKTEEDERMAPRIQKDLNELFFRQKQENPGGLDAFSADRIQELELQLMQSENPSLIYYRVNRAYFERVEDAGGGFRVVANGKRLIPYLKSRPGRKKLFAMDHARVVEMTRQPCFSAAEDCGEFASDGDENTALLEEWVKKYPEKEFQSPKEAVLRGYLASLEKYRKKFPKPKGKSKKLSRSEQAHVLVGTHIRGVELLLETF